MIRNVDSQSRILINYALYFSSVPVGFCSLPGIAIPGYRFFRP
jgi:hypothetical protein